MFLYFGYGSNLNLTSLRAKGVEPRWSAPATLSGWRLHFNVRHWFRHEGGMGNIQPSKTDTDRVHGLVHLCEDAHLEPLDAVEAFGVGYDRIEVDVDTDRGPMQAVTYIGLPEFLDDTCRPTARYLNILVAGAVAAGLDPEYIDWLRAHPLHPPWDYPPFERPAQPDTEFDRRRLAEHPLYTALAGAVFDMSQARPEHEYLKGLFGGRDTTLFHLRRLDTSDGSETLEDVKCGRLSPTARVYLNAYLHEYHAEYRYVGRFVYD